MGDGYVGGHPTEAKQGRVYSKREKNKKEKGHIYILVAWGYFGGIVGRFSSWVG
jgi:hypothetical protein